MPPYLWRDNAKNTQDIVNLLLYYPATKEIVSPHVEIFRDGKRGLQGSRYVFRWHWLAEQMKAYGTQGLLQSLIESSEQLQNIELRECAHCLLQIRYQFYVNQAKQISGA